jgi:hypothetical protein
MTGVDEHEVYRLFWYKLYITHFWQSFYKFLLTVKILSIHAVSACIMQTIVVYIDQLNPDCL